MRVTVPQSLIDLPDQDPRLWHWAESLGYGRVISSWQAFHRDTVQDWFHDHRSAEWVMVIAVTDSHLATEFLDGSVEPMRRGEAVIFAGDRQHRAQQGHSQDARICTVLLLTTL